jgi:hypothetical protein
MPYTLTYDETGFIKLFYEGDANLNDMKAIIANGVSLAIEKNCFKVLSDFRTMKLNLSVMDLFSIPKNQIIQSQELNVPFTKFRRAVIVPKEQFDKYKFFENVAVNRAHQIKVFIDLDEAMAWLLQTQS